MGIKKGGKLIAAIIAVFSFITIAWFSCTKAGSNLNTCNYYVCENGGYCHRDTLTKLVGCICPTGYEGQSCATKSVTKYIGTWDMMQVITGSDSSAFKNDTLRYTVFLKATATPTTFFIDNFGTNQFYNNIICTLDSANSSDFVIDTISAFHLMYDNYHIVLGYGSIAANDSLINAFMITRHLSPTSNWINDTFVLTMTPHLF